MLKRLQVLLEVWEGLDNILVDYVDHATSVNITPMWKGSLWVVDSEGGKNILWQSFGVGGKGSFDSYQLCSGFRDPSLAFVGLPSCGYHVIHDTLW